MINYEEALKIARQHKTKINHCIEYTNAYAFEFDNGEYTMGGDSPIVIMKENGAITDIASYSITPGKSVVRDFKVQ